MNQELFSAGGVGAGYILMLDIDGVLHPEPVQAVDVLCSLPLLHDILKARPKMRVVVTSDWRLRHSLEELSAMLSAGAPGLRRRVVGMTPELPDCRHEYQGREREVMAWITANGGPEWIALDDVAGNYAYGSKQVYLTDYRTGLIPADVPKILARLPV